eukprot:3399074-Rhodomonas_salina.1
MFCEHGQSGTNLWETATPGYTPNLTSSNTRKRVPQAGPLAGRLGTPPCQWPLRACSSSAVTVTVGGGASSSTGKLLCSQCHWQSVET